MYGHVFSEAIEKIINNIFSEFYERGISDPYEFFIEKIMEIKGVSREEAENILKEILKGITKYRELSENPEEVEKVLKKLPEKDKQEIETEITRIVEIKFGGVKNE